MKKLTLIGVAAAVVLLIALFTTLRGWSSQGPLQRDITVQIPQGASLASAANRLEEAGVIGSASRFRLQARLFGSDEPIKAGEFQIPARISRSDLLGLLQGGKVLQRMVVVPEGYPSVLVHDALMRADGLEGQVPVPAEGTVLPDSYSFERGDRRGEVVARMQKAMRDYVAQAWPKRQPNSVVKTPQELVTLASIVEKETGEPSERRMVAAVYSNRLRIGMKLDADPTVIYPITKGRPLGRRILRSELNAKNGYNTYASPGLPVGPIANPGRESIDAVLNPAESKALYFVADGTGGHVFANTLAEHNANVRKWYAIRKARGEM